MGVPYEFNWYLVIENETKINKHGNKYSTIKSEHRIYPINSEIPLIFKDKGCIGLVRITSFKINCNTTEIEFEYIQDFDITGEIAKHYYDMYLYMKNKSMHN